MSETCKTCGKVCEDFKELAHHILEKSTTHRYGSKWAHSYLLKVNLLNQKKDLPSGRIELTDEEKQAKKDSRRELSGVDRPILAVCPSCRNRYPIKIPIEYIQSNNAWRESGMIVITCNNCRR